MERTDGAGGNGSGRSFHPAAVTPAEAGAMLTACLGIFQRWELSREQSLTLLGEIPPRVFLERNGGGEGIMAGDTVLRLGHILAIHASLRTLFHDPARSYVWVKRPNAVFGGKSAMDVMLCGSEADLARVRDFLEAERFA